MAAQYFAAAVDLLSMYLIIVFKKWSAAQTRWHQITGQIVDKKDMQGSECGFM
jgi:hypothetical protein